MTNVMRKMFIRNKIIFSKFKNVITEIQFIDV